MSTKESGAGSSDKKKLGPCMVCEEDADGYFFGANVCLPCKSFFVRTLNEEPSGMKCSKNTSACVILGSTRSSCKYCRFQKCLKVGMTRKVRPEIVEAGVNQELCAVCQDIANGIHFGALTCEGCKKFFRRSLKEHGRYVCRYEKNCTINPRTRNSCRYCRYQKCLRQGMSKDVKIGRPRKELFLSLSSSESNSKMGQEKKSDEQNIETSSPLVMNSKNNSYFAQSVNETELKQSCPSFTESSSGHSTVADLTSFTTDVTDVAVSHYDTTAMKHVAENIKYGQKMNMDGSASTSFDMTVRVKGDASVLEQQDQSPELMNMLLPNTDNNKMFYDSESAKPLIVDQSLPVFPAHDPILRNLHDVTMPLQSSNPSLLDHGKDISMYSTLDHCEASNLNLEKPQDRFMNIYQSEKNSENVNMLKHKLDYHPMEKENVCSCKKLRKLAVENMDVPLHMKAMLMKRIESGNLTEKESGMKDAPNPMSLMSNFMAKGSDCTLSTMMQMDEGKLSPFSMMSSMMSMDSEKKLEIMSKMMSSGDMMSKMLSGGDMMSKMMSIGDMPRSGEDTSPFSMMSRLRNMESHAESQMPNTNSDLTYNIKHKTEPPTLNMYKAPCTIDQDEIKLKTEPGIDAGESCNDKDLFCFNNILEKFDRIKCPSCSNSYFYDQDWSAKSQGNEAIESNCGSLGYSEQICFVHSPKSPEQLSSFSHIPPSNSNCVCLKDLLGTAGDGNSKCEPREGLVSLHDIRIKAVPMQSTKSPFTMMIEKMMDQRQITENKHKLIHPTPESCTDTVDRLRKLLKFFGIEEIQPKSNTRFESYVFRDEYWLKPQLPDENIMLDIKNKEMLEIVVSAYNHLITIMHEKVVSSKPLGDKPAQLPMDIVRKRTIRNLSHWITFIKTIPNFVNIDPGDQFTIVRLGGMMGIMLATALHQYDTDEHNFTNFYNFEFDPEHPHYHFRFALLNYGRDIQELQCDFVESAMMNACMAVALDYPDIEEPEIIEDIRVNLLEAFRAYTTAKYGTPNGRVEKIFAWIPRLRDLGMWNYKLSFSTCFSFEEAAGNSRATSIEKSS